MRALQNRTAGDSRARTILLATTIGKTDVIQAEALGVSGILSKETSQEVLFDCVRSVAAGYCWRGRQRLDDLADGMRDLSAIHKNRFGLTKRELEVVECILRGDRNKRIASRLSIAESTVEHHLSRVFRKIGVFGRVQLAAFALIHQLIPRAGMAWDGRTPCGCELAAPASSVSRVH
jgi:two-component system nitrate/nitrite response regulator NarL